jgi:hypothetical protein
VGRFDAVSSPMNRASAFSSNDRERLSRLGRAVPGRGHLGGRVADLRTAEDETARPGRSLRTVNPTLRMALLTRRLPRAPRVFAWACPNGLNASPIEASPRSIVAVLQGPEPRAQIERYA